MLTTKLGRSDLKVSRICLGTMTWGNHNTEAEGHAQMDLALDQGVNFWDTAEMYAIPPTKETYGTTETIIGTWFAKTGRRNEVILATKISPELPYIRDNNRIDKANIIAAVETSLQRLQTDYIDLYQLHWPTNRSTYHFNNYWTYTPKSTDKAAIIAQKLEVLETLNDLIQAGKIRHWGLSNDTSWGITHYCQLAENNGLPKPISLQNEYSLLRRRDDTEIGETCLLEGIGHIPWSPLGMGILSGKYLDNQWPENTRFTLNPSSQTRYGYRLTPNVHQATKAYVALAKELNIHPCQLAIAFCLTRPFIASPIIGATNLDQLKINLEAINVTLSQDTLDEIDKINAAHPMPF